MKVPSPPAVPDWIASSVGMRQGSPPAAVETSGTSETKSTSGGGLDWLQQASTELEGEGNRLCITGTEFPWSAPLAIVSQIPIKTTDERRPKLAQAPRA